MEQHFGKWLKKVRGRARLKQHDMAHLVGLETYTTISAWEKQKTPKMSDENREALMDVLGYDSEDDFAAAWKADVMPNLGRLTGLAEMSPHPLLEELAAESGATTGAWSRAFFQWLSEQDPELQTWLRTSTVKKLEAAVRARPPSARPKGYRGQAPASTPT